MSKIQSLSSVCDNAPADTKSEKIAEAIRTLLSALSLPEQEHVLSELIARVRPIPAPRAGKVLGSIVRLLPRRTKWTVAEIKHDVEAQGVSATPKELYNALGYLARRGHIRQVGYGRYDVCGAGLVTADDLELEPLRSDDD